MRLRLNQKSRSKIDPSDLNKILLIRLRRIGDIVMTTPAVGCLRQTFHQAKLTYLVESPYMELVEGHPDLDQIWVLPPHANISEFFFLIRKIKQAGFDAVIDFHGGPRAAWITLFSGARWKIGYHVKYKHFIYDWTLPRGLESGPVHSVINHVNLVSLLGNRKETISRLNIAPPRRLERQKVDSFIQNARISEKQLIALHIAAGNRFRDWGENNIIQLCEKLCARPDTAVVMVGGQEDLHAAERIAANIGNRLFSLVNGLNLRELAALIDRSALFIGPDSGPMHVAATTDTPIITYFGPTLPAHFSPWRSRHTILQIQLECRPCPQRKCIHGDYRCIRSISPETVYQACLKYLKS
jgi:lipopolysaccharide heptosyltransferase II